MSNTSTAFTTWIDTFIDEKGLDLGRIIVVEGEVWGDNLIPLAVVVERAKIASPHEQAAIKKALVRLDFSNVDPMPFFVLLARLIAR